MITNIVQNPNRAHFTKKTLTTAAINNGPAESRNRSSKKRSLGNHPKAANDNHLKTGQR